MNTPHRNGSFSYRAIDDRVKRVLDNRSKLDNTIQSAMPFVKVSSTLNKPDILGTGNYGFTIGLHAIPEDVRYEDIYSNQSGDSLVGYTYTNGGTRRIYTNLDPLEASNTALVNSTFDNGTDLFSTTGTSLIPPPGITSVKIGSNRQGYTLISNISIKVPYLSQLELLQKSFLIPGMGIVIEWGYNYAPEVSPSLGEGSLLTDYMFPWYDKNKFTELCTRLARKRVGLEEILENYVWPNNGKYMWIFGQLANFTMKSNADGSFDVGAKIIGPNEGSWAYQTRNTIIPPRNNAGDVCSGNANSVETYFKNTSNGLNFKTLLDGVYGTESHPWHDHVLKFEKGNLSEGQGEPDDGREPNASETGFGDSEDAYFVTWRFFVNRVLNLDLTNNVFANAGLTEDELEKIKTLRPLIDINQGTPNGQLDDPYEAFVGCNKHLRSVDPGVMIIVNDTAAAIAAADLTKNRADIKDELTQITDLTQAFTIDGSFDFYTNSVSRKEEYGGATLDKGLLSTGVWLNHKAIVQSMLSSDTILGGITNLLNRMNAASGGFWNLTLDTSDPLVDENGEVDDSGVNYSVIDTNFKDNSDYAVSKFIENVHLFNKFIRSADGTIVGSDVIDCDVDLNLPARLFSQIATLGLTQPSDIDENANDNPIIGVNETLRKMFAIESISTLTETGQTIDFTHISQEARRAETIRNALCTGQSGQVTSGLGGVGAQTTSTTEVNALTDDAEELEQLKEQLEEQLASDLCTSQECTDQIRTSRLVNESTGEETIVTGASEEEERPILSPSVQYIGKNSGTTITVPIEQNNRPTSINGRKLYDLGYRNGRINRNDLLSLSIAGNVLYKDAAIQFNAMREAALTAGISFNILNESYRSLQTQIRLIRELGKYGDEAPIGSTNDSGRAATPGRSNHGWAFAVDIPVAENPSLLTWLRNNASEYFFQETVAGEPWHWEYTGPFEDPLDPPTTEPLQIDNVQPDTAVPSEFNVSDDCIPCLTAQQQLDQVNVKLSNLNEYDQGKDTLVKEFPQLNQVFRYVEPYQDHMIANITRDSNFSTSNAFGAAPGGLSISANLTIPGLNGFRVGELFWIDRIPTMYKAFGAFQIISYEHTISQGEWKTILNARYNMLGIRWKESMYRKLGEAIAPSTILEGVEI